MSGLAAAWKAFSGKKTPSSSPSSQQSEEEDAKILRMEEQQTAERTSRAEFFGGVHERCLCSCEQCSEALSSASERRPCWMGDRGVLAGLVKDALLKGVMSRHPTTRQSSIASFTRLTEEIKPEGCSDLVYLSSIKRDDLKRVLEKP